MTARKKVVAWAVDFGKLGIEAFTTRDAAVYRARDCTIMANRVVRLVEADPLRDAVVRAAVRAMENARFAVSGTPALKHWERLSAAVDRLQKRGQK